MPPSPPWRRRWASSRTTDSLARLLGLLRRLEAGHAGIVAGPNNDLNVGLPIKFYVFEEGTFVVSSSPVRAQSATSSQTRPAKQAALTRPVGTTGTRGWSGVGPGT